MGRWGRYLSSFYGNDRLTLIVCDGDEAIYFALMKLALEQLALVDQLAAMFGLRDRAPRVEQRAHMAFAMTFWIARPSAEALAWGCSRWVETRLRLRRWVRS